MHILIEVKQWGSVPKGKRKAPEPTFIQQGTLKESAKFEEVSSVRTESFGAQEKIKSDEVIPLLQSLIGNILKHRDTRKILASDFETIENCMEQVITKDIPVDLLIKCNIGLLLKNFYDFVHLNPQLKLLETITRCAFKKLRKRTCEKLFGVKKTLEYSPEEEKSSELTNIPPKQSNEAERFNEEIKEEIEDIARINAEAEELDIKQKLPKRGKLKKGIAKKTTHTYSLRQMPRKIKRHDVSRKRKPRTKESKVNPKKRENEIKGLNEEERKTGLDHDKKSEELIGELTTLLKEVSSTLITRIERDKNSSEFSTENSGICEGDRFKYGRYI